jgi:hypothetical protein
MTAAMLVLEPIFEADLPPELYAYRPGRNAQQVAGRLALRRPASKKRQGTKSREAWERLGGERYGDFRLAPSSLGGATLGRRCLDACTQGWARE